MKVLYTRGLGQSSAQGIISQAKSGLARSPLLNEDDVRNLNWAVGLPPLVLLEKLLLSGVNPSLSPEVLQAYSDLLDNVITPRRARNFVVSTPPPQVIEIGRGVLDPLLQGTVFLPFAADLFYVIAYFESNYKFDAVNEGSGAYGLIQFLPSTSAALQKSYGLPDLTLATYGLYAQKFFGEYPSLLRKVPRVGLLSTVPPDAQGSQAVVRILTAHRAGFSRATVSRLSIQKDLALRILAFIGRVCQRILLTSKGGPV